ncbi:hypothetical protein N7G274_000987 [Stereocaulon virgatum]|uniref:Uncharacterized protein n=1 Tax=Stereocaulon virgatum TaxID=373712 RepID=A0ABR4AQQ7_9LECA
MADLRHLRRLARRGSGCFDSGRLNSPISLSTIRSQRSSPPLLDAADPDPVPPHLWVSYALLTPTSPFAGLKHLSFHQIIRARALTLSANHHYGPCSPYVRRRVSPARL